MKALIAEASAWSTCQFATEFLKFSEFQDPQQLRTGL